MFAKLKKKIEDESGVILSSEVPGRAMAYRDCGPNLARTGSVQHLAYSPPGSIAGDNVSMQDVSRDDMAVLLQKKSEQCKKLESSIIDLAAMVKEKSKAIEKLEASLKQQEEATDRRLQDLKAEFERSQDKSQTHHQEISLHKPANMVDALTNGRSQEESPSRQIHSVTDQVIDRDEVGHLKLKVVTLETEMLKLKADNREKALLVTSLTTDKSTLAQRLETVNKEISQLQQHTSAVEMELDQVKTAKDQLEKHLKISEEEKGELSERCVDLIKQIENLNSSNLASRVKFECKMKQQSMTIESLKESEVTLRQKVDLLEQMVNESDMASERLDDMSKTISSLETQLAEKNRTLKKQEQMLKDLRVSLQRELKVQSLPNDESLDSVGTTTSSNSLATSKKFGSQSQLGPGHHDFHHYQHHHQKHDHSHSNNTTTSAAVLSVGPSPPDMVTVVASSSSVPGTNSHGMNFQPANVKKQLDNDINFLYLKNVVLKFMLSREPEAIQLIKAVAMLLDFTHQEQQLIKDTLEWKMSWFGPRPSVGKGQTSRVIPPAL